jgi:hypothetical protein
MTNGHCTELETVNKSEQQSTDLARDKKKPSVPRTETTGTKCVVPESPPPRVDRS